VIFDWKSIGYEEDDRIDSIPYKCIPRFPGVTETTGKTSATQAVYREFGDVEAWDVYLATTTDKAPI